MIIGDGNVGKTLLLKVFEKGEYVELSSREQAGTIIPVNSEKIIKHPTSVGDELVLQL